MKALILVLVSCVGFSGLVAMPKKVSPEDRKLLQKEYQVQQLHKQLSKAKKINKSKKREEDGSENTRFEKQLDKLSDRLDDKIEKLKDEFAGKISDLREQIRELERKIKELSKSSNGIKDDVRIVRLEKQVKALFGELKKIASVHSAKQVPKHVVKKVVRQVAAPIAEPVA